MLFSTFDLKSKLINKISSYTFPIYIIHDNYYLRNNIYNWFNISLKNHSSTVECIVVIIICAFSIFVISLLIEFFRRFIVMLLSKSTCLQEIKKRVVNFLLRNKEK